MPHVLPRPGAQRSQLRTGQKNVGSNCNVYINEGECKFVKNNGDLYIMKANLLLC